MKIVIISHTEHYENTNGEILGWGATVRELNHLATICDSLLHLAPLHQGTPPKSSLAYTANNISYYPLKPSGGRGFQKLSLLTNAFANLRTIQHYTADADWIQFRAPTGIGVYVLPYLELFRRKKYWVKYAGNWIDPEMPLGNKLQKFWLKYCTRTAKVTINGQWEKSARFLAFENPSLTSEEYKYAHDYQQFKTKPQETGWRLCFVGALNEHKGVSLIIEALARSDSSFQSQIKEMVFIGDGEEKEKFKEKALNLGVSCRFLGFLDKDEVFNELSKSHALLLPSKSEGFPKVVGEAMACACVPITTDVSCIRDYIEDAKNGYVMNARNSNALIEKLKRLLNLSFQEYNTMTLKNLKFAERFTYDYYIKALKHQIFNAAKKDHN